MATLSPATRVRRSRPSASAVLIWLFVAAGAVVVIFPLYWMLVTAITPISDLRSATYSVVPTAFRWHNFVTAWNQLPFGQWYINSTVIALGSVALTVCINLLCGYTFAKLRFPGRNILFVLMLSTLMIPIQVLMVPQYRIVVSLGWLNTVWAVIIPRSAEAFGIFMARQYFSTIPRELLEAARIDGASEFTIFRRVALPLAKPLIATLVIFTFMWRWNEFAWPLIILKDQASYTVPVGLLFLRGQFATNYNNLMAMTLVSILPIIAIFVFFQRYFVQGMARSGLK